MRSHRSVKDSEWGLGMRESGVMSSGATLYVLPKVTVSKTERLAEGFLFGIIVGSAVGFWFIVYKRIVR